MTTRLASAAAALALIVAVPAVASAQVYAAPAIVPIAAVEGSTGWQPREPVGLYSAGRDRNGIDSSAKGGNAAQPERAVPQYGTTSGGPAY